MIPFILDVVRNETSADGRKDILAYLSKRLGKRKTNKKTMLLALQ